MCQMCESRISKFILSYKKLLKKDLTTSGQYLDAFITDIVLIKVDPDNISKVHPLNKLNRILIEAKLPEYESMYE